MSDFDREFWGELEEDFRAARRANEEALRRFESLNIDRCVDVPDVGDRVIVAAGLLGMGFPWVRYEAIVIEAGTQSYKVRFLDYKGYDNRVVEKWIHPALVTDVLRAKK